MTERSPGAGTPPPPARTANTALVIGCGIAGPVAAVALQKAGFSPVIYESYEESADSVGAFLGLGVNGIDALRALGIDATVVARGFATPRNVILNGDGKILADFPNGGTLPDGTGAITISRAALYAALKDEAVRRGIPIEHGKRLVGAEPRSDGVHARFADGTSADGAVLIGADGIRSVARTLIDPSAPPPAYVGFLNTAGYAYGVDIGVEAGANYLVFGKRSFFGYVQHPNGEVWWFANPPSRDEPDPAKLAAVPAHEWRTYLERLFAEDDTPALRLIRHSDHIFAGWVTYDMPSVPTWHNQRMVVIGDAAHAISPSAGQGASMALEDAVVLAQCLRDVADVPAALSRYEALRRGRVERVAAQGRRNGNGKTVGPVGRALRDAFMPAAMRFMFRGGRDPFSWVWDHHIEWDDRISSDSAEPERTTRRRDQATT